MGVSGDPAGGGAFRQCRCRGQAGRMSASLGAADWGQPAAFYNWPLYAFFWNAAFPPPLLFKRGEAGVLLLSIWGPGGKQSAERWHGVRQGTGHYTDAGADRAPVCQPGEQPADQGQPAAFMTRLSSASLQRPAPSHPEHPWAIQAVIV